MEFKSMDVLTSVGNNVIQEADNTVAKAILTVEEVVVKNKIPLIIAGLSVATNIAVGLVPEEWTLATQIADKLDMADVVEYADKGADVALLGSAVAIVSNAKKIYEGFESVDKMTPEELKAFLTKRSKERFTKEEIIEEAVVVAG